MRTRRRHLHILPLALVILSHSSVAWAAEEAKNTQNSATDVWALASVALTLLVAGLLGGFVNVLRERSVVPPDATPPSSWKRLPLHLVQGFAAATVVPLFLFFTQSTLWKEAQSDPSSAFVLFGLGVVVAISAEPFLNGVTNRLFQELEQQKKQLEEQKNKLLEQEKQLEEQKNRLLEQRRKLEEQDEKLRSQQDEIKNGARLFNARFDEFALNLSNRG